MRLRASRLQRSDFWPVNYIRHAACGESAAYQRAGCLISMRYDEKFAQFAKGNAIAFHHMCNHSFIFGRLYRCRLLETKRMVIQTHASMATVFFPLLTLAPSFMLWTGGRNARQAVAEGRAVAGEAHSNVTSCPSPGQGKVD